MTDLLDPPALRADVVPGTVTGAATIHRRRWWTLALIWLPARAAGQGDEPSRDLRPTG